MDSLCSFISYLLKVNTAFDIHAQKKKQFCYLYKFDEITTRTAIKNWLYNRSCEYYHILNNDQPKFLGPEQSIYEIHGKFSFVGLCVQLNNGNLVKKKDFIIFPMFLLDLIFTAINFVCSNFFLY